VVGPAFDSEIIIYPIDHLPDYRWNLRKIYIYNKDNGLSGRVILMDLDIIITGDITEICEQKEKFITCRGAFTDKIGGSLTSFPAGAWHNILWKPLKNKTEIIEKNTNGSERKYYQMILADREVCFWEDLLPGQVLSYKRDCRDGVPKGAKIVRFHGNPRPHEVKHKWISKKWK
jgi:hypothetical protein